MKDNLNELFGALAKAQVEMTNASKNVDNAYLKSKYADLSSVMDAARPYLAKNGLAVIQRMIMVEGELHLQTILGHSSGQSIESTIRVEVKEGNNSNQKTNYMHALGSSLSYLRRYSYAALVGVAVGTNDDDGNMAVPPEYKPTNGKTSAAPAAVVPLVNDEELKALYDKLKLMAIIQAEEENESSFNDESVIQLIADNLLKETLAKGKINDLAQLPAARFQGLMNWLDGK